MFVFVCGISVVRMMFVFVFVFGSRVCVCVFVSCYGLVLCCLGVGVAKGNISVG